ncbi:MAG: sugar ABC transporter substrate-binding protein, partial [Sciscionella sp.]
MRRSTLALVAMSAGLVVATSACGANGSAGPTQSTGSATAGGGGSASGPKIGVILPDTASSARYVAYDQPMLQKALTNQGLSPTIENAQGDTQKFAQIVDSML